MENPATLDEEFMKVSTQEYAFDALVQALKEHGPFGIFMKSCVAHVVERIDVKYSANMQSAVISPLIEVCKAEHRANVSHGQKLKSPPAV